MFRRWPSADGDGDEDARPVNGVFVEKDSYWSRQAGLQAGDIIVGVDGWKVENFEQLDAVLWFKPHAKTHKFTAWRGVLFTVEISDQSRDDAEDASAQGLDRMKRCDRRGRCCLCGFPGVSAAQNLAARRRALETPYQTEHAWAVREITADITEMARVSREGPGRAGVHRADRAVAS